MRASIRILFAAGLGALLCNATASGDPAAKTAPPAAATAAPAAQAAPPEGVNPVPVTTPAPVADAATGEVYKAGAAVSPSPALSLADLVAAPEKYSGKTLVVEGVVAEVCQNKGCWMTLRQADQEMRVRFQDYAFFVPKTCSGKTARLEGKFEVQDVPVAEARHYLEDAGKKAEAEKIVAPVKSFTFMASGVELH